MSAVKPHRFWEWLQWKLQQIWPNRNYNRAMDLPNYYHTPTMKNFIKSYNSKVGLLIEKPRKEYEEEFNSVPGMFRDIDEFVFISEDDVPSREPRPDERFQFEDNTNTREREVEIDMVDNVLLNDEQIKNLYLSIEKLMKEHNLNSDSSEDSTE